MSRIVTTILSYELAQTDLKPTKVTKDWDFGTGQRREFLQRPRLRGFKSILSLFKKLRHCQWRQRPLYNFICERKSLYDRHFFGRFDPSISQCKLLKAEIAEFGDLSISHRYGRLVARFFQVGFTGSEPRTVVQSQRLWQTFSSPEQVSGFITDLFNVQWFALEYRKVVNHW